MSHPGYLCLGGMEIVNQQRVTTYAAAGWKPASLDVRGCSTCGPELALALDEPNGEYSNPGSDGAPWLSPTEPDSLDFGGLYVLSVDGLEPGAFTREQTARASGRGSFLSPGAQASPQIAVTGVLLGRTCCSVAYGYRWLRNVLRGSCGDGCDGDDLTFLDCCPEWCEDADGFTSYADCLTPYLRTMKGVGLVQSPTITGRFGSSCGCDGAAALQVQFVLAASEPCVFREPVPVETEVLFDTDNPTACVEWVATPPGQPCPDGDACGQPADCLADPGCPPPPKPPTPPAAYNPCICDPMQTVSACIDMPADVVPDFAEGVPIIEIASGSSELRQVRMRFMLNPLGLPADQLDPCTACGEVTLSRIPPYSTFRMDGLNHTVTIECPGSASTDATPLLGVAGGRLPFRYPEIVCGGSPYTMCVEADAASAAEDAYISLSVAVREC